MRDERPVGFPVPGWSVPVAPCGDILEGRYTRLEPLNAEAHAALLYRAYQADDWVWDYMPYGPFHSAAQYHRWVRETVKNPDHFFYAIYSKEPKLRDSFLQVLFDHANIGGFDGAFTNANNLAVLRGALREVAQKDMGDQVTDVLIVEIARQDY